jgi:hypothetical protein
LTSCFLLIVGIIYRPNVDFYGNDELLVTVNDMGNTGICQNTPICQNFIEEDPDLCEIYNKNLNICQLTDQMTIPIVVEPIPDPVEILTPLGILIFNSCFIIFYPSRRFDTKRLV